MFDIGMHIGLPTPIMEFSAPPTNQVIILWISLSAFVSCESVSEVTLSHGGQLRGLKTAFQNVPVDLFLGVKYAQAPVGELRFRKPKEVPTWKGVMEALQSGNACPQPTAGRSHRGDEDCLFLDITVPGRVQKEVKKPVMVFFHGGGYLQGSGSGFIGGPLAVTGDVIVVTVNNRLGIFGFLSDGSGTGNFGLWDQRAALVWIKDNIVHFGGDPELVTIFGQSAGAGSVAAQMMSPHNEGLFKRGIQESGSLYASFSWFNSEMLTRTHVDLLNFLRESTNCHSLEISIYDCLQDVPVEDLIAKSTFAYPLATPLRLAADSDFFSSEVDSMTYKLTEKYDLMAGISEQEGLSLYYFHTAVYAQSKNVSLENGVSVQFVEEYIKSMCSFWFTPYSVELCADFLIRTYKLKIAPDDRKRALRLIELLGEHMFVSDLFYELEEHSKNGSTSSYGYYFTEPLQDANRLWPKPHWMKPMAGHVDEQKYVFGSPFIFNESVTFWKDKANSSPSIAKMFASSAESDKLLSQAMMIMWSNFAKTGNPNKPNALPDKVPTWPKFTADANQFLEINSKNMQVITTPHKERIDRLRSVLYTDRQTQLQLGKSLREGKYK